MSGLDCLKAEMLKRGLTKQQCESKLIPVVLDILSDSDNHTKYFILKNEIDSMEKYLDHQNKRYNQERKEYEKWRDETESYVLKLLSKLKECETPEERDRMKIAQMFVNSVNVNTKYDNTAYIIGLAAILSNGKISAIDELRKINPKLPSKTLGNL